MKRLLALALAVAAGLTLYGLVFTLAVRKPLTVDAIGRYVAAKQAILRATRSPRIIIFAGSNGRFSHSCAAITAATGTPCANMSIHAGLGLRYQLDAWIAAVRSGDLVYMPLEYRVAGPALAAFMGDEAAFLVAHDPAALVRLYGWRGLPRALLQFDLRSLIASLGEMALDARGTIRRFGPGSLDAQGDELGNSAAAARPLAAYRAALPVTVVDAAAYADRRYWADVAAAIDRLRARGAIVAGGLPTIFDDTRGVDRAAAFLAAFYAARGGCFIALPGRSLYPRREFYDGAYHLAAPAARHHSRLLAPQLQAMLTAQGCGADTLPTVPAALPPPRR